LVRAPQAENGGSGSAWGVVTLVRSLGFAFAVYSLVFRLYVFLAFSLRVVSSLVARLFVVARSLARVQLLRVCVQLLGVCVRLLRVCVQFVCSCWAFVCVYCAFVCSLCAVVAPCFAVVVAPCFAVVVCRLCAILCALFRCTRLNYEVELRLVLYVVAFVVFSFCTIVSARFSFH